jgi:HK97 family phage major capsid protein
MLRSYADVKSSALDVPIPVRTGIPTFGWIAEGGTYPKSGSQYGKLAMHAHKCGGTVLISDELLQDSSENMEAEINETAGLAFGELESVGFATGDGVGKPLGLFVPDAVAGVTIGSVTAASATAVTSDELIDVFHSITEPYRRNAAWVMRDSTVKLVRKLKNAVTGDYMWQPGLQAGQPDLLLAKPVVVHKDAPAATASSKSIIFGNLKAYRIRDRLGISVKALNEAYAEQGQVGFRFTKRTDGKLCDAKAVAYLKMHT